MIKKLFISILSWLLHHANKRPSTSFYKIKQLILDKYGVVIGYDVQFIPGKKCFSCDGTGIYNYYDHRVSYMCYNCYDGWFKRPVWNILYRISFGKYILHQPFKRVYNDPKLIFETSKIDGYINHLPTKYTSLSLFVLFICYEKGYLKRWYNETGRGWRLKFYYPKNIIPNMIHIIKNGKKSIPFQYLYDWFNNKRSFLIVRNGLSELRIDDDLPF